MPEVRHDSAPTSGQDGGTEPGHQRSHLFEVDLLRAITALAVVGVHVTAFTVGLNRSQGGVQAQQAVVALLHFTRENFLSITALVLVYRYAHGPFSARAFWRKRGLGVLLPYVLWSLLYSWLNRPRESLLHWCGLALRDMLTGSASFQLYFILLTLQLYLVLPVLLRFLDRLNRHPWRLLVGSFVLEVVLLFVDFSMIQSGPFARTRVAEIISGYQGRYLPLYQLYVVLGAVAALFIEQVRAFVLRHGRWMIVIAVCGVAIYLGHYFYAVRVEQQSVDLETSVFQPTMAFYAPAISLFLYWMSAVWAVRHKPEHAPSGFRFVSLLSEASFGIYLVHPLFLSPTVAHIAPALPAAWPVSMRVFLLWIAVAGASVLASVALLRIPFLRLLVGKARPARTEEEAQRPPQRATAPLSPRTRERMPHTVTMNSAAGENE
jgi:surface polysaccharide O-acyltransferase-like enzyme